MAIRSPGDVIPSIESAANRAKRRLAGLNIPSTVEGLSKESMTALNSDAGAESVRMVLAEVQRSPNYVGTIKGLLSLVIKGNRKISWNAASVLAVCDKEIVLKGVKEVDPNKISDSAAAIWLLGQMRLKDETVRKILYDTVERGSDVDDKCWWNAAFALEELGYEQAIPYLKRSMRRKPIPSVYECFREIHSRKALVGILAQVMQENLREVVYPKVIEVFQQIGTKHHANSYMEHQQDWLTNMAYLVGRLRISNPAITSKLIGIVNGGMNYNEIMHTCVWTLGQIEDDSAHAFLLELVEADQADDLLRQVAVKALLPHIQRSAKPEATLEVLRKRLLRERGNPRMVTVLSETISKATKYAAKPINPSLRISAMPENGSIVDNRIKWYGKDVGKVYERFSQAQDPDSIGFGMIAAGLEEQGHVIENPIDLAAGTGKIAAWLLEKSGLQYHGKLTCVDGSEEMCGFLKTRFKSGEADVIKSKIADLPDNVEESSSSLVISSFGFPSKTSDPEVALAELKAVEKALKSGGIFITYGWDKAPVQCRLREMWYRFVPDKIEARDYNEWATKEASRESSPRNCGLTWWANGIRLPVRFENATDSTYVLGTLFGRDAGEWAAAKRVTTLDMQVGITWNTKEDLVRIIKQLSHGKRSGDPVPPT